MARPTTLTFAMISYSRGPPASSAIFLLSFLLCGCHLSAATAAANPERKVQTFDLRPTASLLLLRDDDDTDDSSSRRMKRNDRIRRHLSDGRLSSVYATLAELPPRDDDDVDASIVEEHNLLVSEFNARRHLSRHEIIWREYHGVDPDALNGDVRRMLDGDDGKEEEAEDVDVPPSGGVDESQGDSSSAADAGDGNEQGQEGGEWLSPDCLLSPASLISQPCAYTVDMMACKGPWSPNTPQKYELRPKTSSKEPPEEQILTGVEVFSYKMINLNRPGGKPCEIVAAMDADFLGGPAATPVSVQCDRGACTVQRRCEVSCRDAIGAGEEVGGNAEKDLGAEHGDEHGPMEVDIDLQPYAISAEESTVASRRNQSAATVGSGMTKKGGLLNSYQAAPLSQGYGTHYAMVWVGTPPQRKSVIVDTGSHFTAFPCKGCQSCGEEHHTDKYFDPDASATFHALGCNECRSARCSRGQCVFSQSYTEGSSWQAYQARDKFFCGGNDIVAATSPVDNGFKIDFMFGCQTSETGLFVTQLADGIMGMSAHEATLPKQMYENGKLEHNLFTLCFRRELNVDKQGISAGTMTLGGIDTRLTSTPMVYARNVARSGWYTVYVKNVFIRSNGGQSAKSDNPGEQHIMKVPLDISAVNSGKGVIVDSGTTDTYLHQGIAKNFGDVWKEVTGKAYSNAAIRLTQKDLLRLPTVLVQVEAFNDAPDPSLGSSEDVPGLVGSLLDPHSPHDILLAIPATNYMEYSPSKDVYTSRLYFTESRGGVLGANAMQGHDVLFDWENGRIGFAESTCEYQGGENTGTDGHANGVDGGGEGIVSNNCRLGVPHLSSKCAESVDLNLCGSDANKVLEGTEKWVRVVESPGTVAGMPCEAVAEQEHALNGEGGMRGVICDKKGLCTEIHTCRIKCADAKAESEKQSETSPVTKDAKSSGNKDSSCGENFWSSCEHSCTQTKLHSEYSDGKCHAVKSLQLSRPCHIDACGRSDPCRVPFVVHAIIAFRGGAAQLWNKRAEEAFADAFANAVNKGRRPKDELFGPGDVNVLLANAWHQSDDAQVVAAQAGSSNDEELGMKLVVEISIFNPNAKIPDVPLPDGVPQKEDKDSPKQENDLKYDTGPPLSACEESDLYPLARSALDVHMELGRDNFISDLVGFFNNEGKEISPFKNLLESPTLAAQSELVTSWTIKTDIGVGAVHGDGAGGKDVMYYIKNGSLAVVICVVVFTTCAGMCYCCKWGRKQFERIQKSRLAKKMRDGERRRGRYTRVGGGSIASVLSDDDDFDFPKMLEVP